MQLFAQQRIGLKAAGPKESNEGIAEALWAPPAECKTGFMFAFNLSVVLYLLSFLPKAFPQVPTAGFAECICVSAKTRRNANPT